MRRLRFYAGLLMGGVLMLFALQNLHATPVMLFLWRIEAPLIVIVLASSLIGAIWVALWLGLVRHRRTHAVLPDTPSGLPPKSAS